MNQKWNELTPDQQRAIILEAFAAPEGSRNAVAREHGIDRRYMYQLLAEYRAEPELALEEARKEAEFRRQVLEYVRQERMTA